MLVSTILPRELDESDTIILVLPVNVEIVALTGAMVLSSVEPNDSGAIEVEVLVKLDEADSDPNGVDVEFEEVDGKEKLVSTAELVEIVVMPAGRTTGVMLAIFELEVELIILGRVVQVAETKSELKGLDPPIVESNELSELEVVAAESALRGINVEELVSEKSVCATTLLELKGRELELVEALIALRTPVVLTSVEIAAVSFTAAAVAPEIVANVDLVDAMAGALAEELSVVLEVLEVLGFVPLGRVPETTRPNADEDTSVVTRLKRDDSEDDKVTKLLLVDELVVDDAGIPVDAADMGSPSGPIVVLEADACVTAPSSRALPVVLLVSSNGDDVIDVEELLGMEVEVYPLIELEELLKGVETVAEFAESLEEKLAEVRTVFDVLLDPMLLDVELLDNRAERSGESVLTVEPMLLVLACHGVDELLNRLLEILLRELLRKVPGTVLDMLFNRLLDVALASTAGSSEVELLRVLLRLKESLMELLVMLVEPLAGAILVDASIALLDMALIEVLVALLKTLLEALEDEVVPELPDPMLLGRVTGSRPAELLGLLDEALNEVLVALLEMLLAALDDEVVLELTDPELLERMTGRRPAELLIDTLDIEPLNGLVAVALIVLPVPLVTDSLDVLGEIVPLK